ncbi:MAG: EAL domain-containing protein, partial [Cyanobacteria bacterium J06607_15]
KEITLAHNLGMDAIAEGVETISQAQQLKTLGCEYAQGYLFAKPIAVEAIELILQETASFCLQKI